MPAPAVRQFAGDIRFWEQAANGDLIPVIPNAADPTGNQPIETNTLSFSYEAGDEQKVISKRRDARYNQPIHSETLPGTTSVSTTLLELPPLILARILFGVDKRLAYDSRASYFILSLNGGEPILNSFHIEKQTDVSKEDLRIR